MTIAGLWRYVDWRHVATGCTGLEGLGEGELTEVKLEAAETFVCKTYGLEHVDSADKLLVVSCFPSQGNQRLCLQPLMPCISILCEPINKL